MLHKSSTLFVNCKDEKREKVWDTAIEVPWAPFHSCEYDITVYCPDGCQAPLHYSSLFAWFISNVEEEEEGEVER